MAGDWIKMRNDLAEDPAVIAIAARCQLDEFAVVGRLHAFWSWADKQSRDGHAHGVTSAWLNRKVQCDKFAEAMIAVGWLEVNDAGLAIPRFDEHNGATAKVRASGTRRKQLQRANEAASFVPPDVPPPSRDMSRSERDKSVTREEKRREVKTTGVARLEPEGFTRFWAAWPKHKRKAAKQQCLARWVSKQLEGRADEIVAHVEAWKRSEDWMKEGGQFIPAPLVYLGQDRFDAPPAGGSAAPAGDWRDAL